MKITLTHRSESPLRRRVAAVALAALAGGALISAADASDWPRYRGPGLDAISTETGLLTAFAEEGPELLWRRDLGDGYSGMSVSAGRLFTLYGRGGDELALALDAATGETLWEVRIDDNRRDQMGAGPRSTPTVDGDTVFVLGAKGMLRALATADGAVRWEVDLVDAFDAGVPQWGVSTSPIVLREFLLVDVGGSDGRSIVAFDKASGAVRWHAGDDKAGYSTPLPVVVNGVEQILFFTGTRLAATTADGRILWHYPWRTSYDVNAAMPIFVPPNQVFVSSSYGKGAALLRIDGDGDSWAARPVWSSRAMKNHFNSSILVDGYLYGFDDGTLKCLEAATGEERWAQRGFAKGSLLYADGKLVVLSERGVLALVEADPGGYRELARSEVLDGRTWTMPTLAEGRLYLRDQDDLVAFRFTP